MARPELPGLDLRTIECWMDDQGLGFGPITDATPITGGTQNILMRFRRADREYVLRRPPLYKRPRSDDTMRREAQVLSALAGTDVPHPRLVAACPDLDVLGAAFYLMEPVAGICPTAHWPDLLRTNPELQHHLGLSLTAGLAALSAVDIHQPALSGLGRPEGWLQRQVARWQRQLDDYRDLDGYPGPQLPDITDVGRWLEERQPDHWTPGLIHGDYHFGNVLVDPSTADLAAIVDWELATVGDPLLDLGHLLATWPAHYPIGGGVDAPHLPDTRTIVEYYGHITGRTVDHIGWYRVLACYRLGIILEGTHARACAGLAPTETGERLHQRAILLLRQAQQLIDGTDTLLGDIYVTA